MNEEIETFGMYVYFDNEYYSKVPLCLQSKIRKYNKDLECYNQAATRTERGKRMLYNRFVKIVDELDMLKVPHIENPVGCCGYELHEDYELETGCCCCENCKGDNSGNV